MALAFFRRRQKLVMIIMVVLMLSFLVGIQGLETLGMGNPAKRTVARTRFGKFRLGQIRSAQSDLHILQSIGLDPRTLPQTLQIRQMYGMPPPPTAAEMMMLHANGANNDQAYALLLVEADKAGAKVSPREVADFKSEMQLTGPAYQNVLTSLNGERLTEKDLDRAIQSWLTICRYVRGASLDVPPSDAELRHVFRDVFEKIDLRVVRMAAKDLVDKVTFEPSDDQILEQFNSYHAMLPGATPDVTSLGFGYRRPDRVQVSYLFISQRAVERTAQPSDDAILRYYRANPNQRVPVPVSPAESLPATAPATGAASQSATAAAPAEPLETVEVELGKLAFSQARPIIRKLLVPDAAAEKMMDLLSAASTLEAELAANPPAGKDLYAAVVERMTSPATAVLAQPIRTAIRGMPLEQAMDVLAKEAGLSVICYPWGKHGKQTLDPSVLVTVTASAGQPVMLMGALEQITRQLNWIKIERWVQCERLDGALLPVPSAEVEGLEIFPLNARTTGMAPADEANNDPVLGSAYNAPAGGIKLLDLAFTSEPFKRMIQEMPQMKVGERSASPMHVRGDVPGRLFWTLAKAAPSEAPAASELNTDPALRKQVVTDLKISAAMGLAVAEASKIEKAAAGGEDLAKAARAAGFETFDTGLFSRRDLSLRWSDVPMLDLEGETLQEHVINTVFGLAPKQVEPTTAGYGVSNLLTISLPPKHEVLVVQRVGYEPPVIGEFNQFRQAILGFLMSRRQAASVGAWFNWGNIRTRLEYRPEEG